MAKRPATQQQRVELARPDAQQALDEIECLGEPSSWASFRYTERVDHLVRLALQDYRFKFSTTSATSEWLFYDGDPSTKKIKVGRDGKPISGRVDVYCTFCRVMLVGDARFDHDYSTQLAKHTTVCALRSLAGAMTPGPPGTYRLPEAL